jgi:hypothetical protein
MCNKRTLTLTSHVANPMKKFCSKKSCTTLGPDVNDSSSTTAKTSPLGKLYKQVCGSSYKVSNIIHNFVRSQTICSFLRLCHGYNYTAHLVKIMFVKDYLFQAIVLASDNI